MIWNKTDNILPSLPSYNRPAPSKGFHGVAKLYYMFVTPSLRQGQHVAMTTPSGTVATLVFPALPYTIVKLKNKFEYEEDERVGETLVRK